MRLWFVTATLDQMNQGAILTKQTPPSRGPSGVSHIQSLSLSLDVPFEEFAAIVRRAIDLHAVSGELADWMRSSQKA